MFTQFGARPTQHRNAAEALLRRLSKQGDIPALSTLVDIGNLVSIRYALPVAVFDLDRVAGLITVRPARGTETFTDLGTHECTNPAPGEVIFVDDEDYVAARRWCWRQSATSSTSVTTVQALMVVEGHHLSAARDVEAALGDLVLLLGRHQPGSELRVGRLSPENRSFFSGD